MDSILELAKKEALRQKQTIRLIASENYVSEDILTVLGSPLTNKYSEGYPTKRYYEGQIYTDAIEQRAITAAKQLFSVNYANVQAYSGSPANLAVYFALLNPGDTIMGLDLPAGGHLTHGFKVSITGQWFHSVPYSLNPETHLIDYDRLEELAREHQPKLIISGHSAYPRIVDFERIGRIAKSVGALHMADISHISGLVATGEHPHPFPHADVITMTTHKILRGPRGALILTNDEKIAKKIDKAVFPGLQGGPHMNNIAGIAIALEEAMTRQYTEYTQQVKANVTTLGKALTDRGFALFTGGSDNHLLLVDLRPRGIDGDTLSKALIQANIETNKNAIPFDDAPPMKPNGIRLGTPAVTTLGMKESEMETIAQYIDDVLQNHNDRLKLTEIQLQVQEFMRRFV